jgi:hypothetical protein
LAAHLESFAQPGPDALVFANAAGNPLTASSFLTHHFSKAQVAAGCVMPIPRPPARDFGAG